jgi:hypothetical protein
MNEPWYDASLYGWLPGTILGCLCGVWGGTAGSLVPRGRWKMLILGGAWLLLAYSAVLLALGALAYLTGQPFGIWYGLGMGGLIGLGVIAGNLPTVYRGYREAEERGMKAHDLA